jgi:5-methylcytosine-specific restriction endonuclease McrA
MNYEKIYFDIVSKARHEGRVRGKDIYYEQHHITPKCMGGNNKKENLVLLTAKEHFIVHKILPLIYPQYRKELSLALHRMTFSTTEKMQRNYRIGAREFERIRQEIAEVLSGDNNPFANKEHTQYVKNTISKKAKERLSKPENHPLFGKPCSDERKEKIRIANTGKKVSAEARKKMSEARSGKPLSKKHRINLSISLTGKKRTEETKEKLRVPKPKYICDHCGKTIGGMSNLHQHLVKKHNIPIGKWANHL